MFRGAALAVGCLVFLVWNAVAERDSSLLQWHMLHLGVSGIVLYSLLQELCF